MPSTKSRDEEKSMFGGRGMKMLWIGGGGDISWWRLQAMERDAVKNHWNGREYFFSIIFEALLKFRMVKYLLSSLSMITV